ncbi:MFS transporter [Streptomyces sp. NPDC058469]|uniref:MFS transporter n=1 Tax=Streptomyces sp. NPDC058469 TaxID=3346514 RepID=UPI00366A46E6
MAPTALLLAAGHEARSLAVGGLLGAGYLVAYAAGQPMLGRLADRIGQVIPLLAGASLAAWSLSALAVFGTGNLPLALSLTIVAGLFNPPLEAGLRTLWPTLLPGPDAVRARYLSAAYALDNGSQEAVYVVGPLLASALAAISPAAALLGTGALGLAGALSVAISRPARAWTPAAPEVRHWLGPLKSRGIRALLTMMFCVGTAVGAVPVYAVAVAEHTGAMWLKGVLPAMLSLGGLLGGLLYGARSWPGTRLQHMTWLAFGFYAAWLPLLVVSTPTASALLIVLPGFCFSVLLCVACLMMSSIVPPGTGTEAFGWLIGFLNIGLALGSALAGMTGGSYAVAMLAAAATALVLLTTRTVLTGTTKGHAPTEHVPSASAVCPDPTR